jgi:outer membrane immunogenic protein
MRSYVFIAAAAALIPAAAAAQGRESPSFVGAHVEGVVGYDRIPSTELNKSGLLYGLGAGYDFGIDTLRIGAEAETTMSTAKGCTTSSAGRLCVDSKRDLYVGARVGAVLLPNLMIYAKGGYTNFRQSSSLKTDTSKVEGGANSGGYRLGAGMQLALSRNAFVKAEYRYSHYHEGVVDYGRHQVVTGVGLRF